MIALNPLNTFIELLLWVAALFMEKVNEI